MQTINTLFATAVERFGDHPALIEPSEEAGMTNLTFRALQERVHGFAGYLQQQQLTKGDSLLIWSASRIDWMVAYLGADSVYLLDGGWPAWLAGGGIKGGTHTKSHNSIGDVYLTLADEVLKAPIGKEFPTAEEKMSAII